MTANHSAPSVLLVEDDPYVAAGIAALLSAEDYAVEIIGLGSHAESAVESFRPDVVLLDVRLPDIGGAEVFQRLRSRWSDLAIIFSSGHANNLEELGATGAGRVGLLKKPYDGATLIRTIHDVLRSPSSHQPEASGA